MMPLSFRRFMAVKMIWLLFVGISLGILLLVLFARVLAQEEWLSSSILDLRRNLGDVGARGTLSLVVL